MSEVALRGFDLDACAVDDFGPRRGVGWWGDLDFDVEEVRFGCEQFIRGASDIACDLIAVGVGFLTAL